jgi:hypothetical protein
MSSSSFSSPILRSDTVIPRKPTKTIKIFFASQQISNLQIDVLSNVITASTKFSALFDSATNTLRLYGRTRKYYTVNNRKYEMFIDDAYVITNSAGNIHENNYCRNDFSGPFSNVLNLSSYAEKLNVFFEWKVQCIHLTKGCCIDSIGENRALLPTRRLYGDNLKLVLHNSTFRARISPVNIMRVECMSSRLKFKPAFHLVLNKLVLRTSNYSSVSGLTVLNELDIQSSDTTCRSSISVYSSCLIGDNTKRILERLSVGSSTEVVLHEVPSPSTLDVNVPSASSSARIREDTPPAFRAVSYRRSDGNLTGMDLMLQDEETLIMLLNVMCDTPVSGQQLNLNFIAQALLGSSRLRESITNNSQQTYFQMVSQALLESRQMYDLQIGESSASSSPQLLEYKDNFAASKSDTRPKLWHITGRNTSLLENYQDRVPLDTSEECCVICLDHEAIIILSPCSHELCYACSTRMQLESTKCPLCRETISTAMPNRWKINHSKSKHKELNKDRERQTRNNKARSKAKGKSKNSSSNSSNKSKNKTKHRRKGTKRTRVSTTTINSHVHKKSKKGASIK